MPPGFLINSNRELLESFGGAEKLLRVRSRKVSIDLLDLLNTEAKTAIACALNRVTQHGEPLAFSGLRYQSLDDEKAYRLSIEPIRGQSEILYLISFSRLEEGPGLPLNF